MLDDEEKPVAGAKVIVEKQYIDGNGREAYEQIRHHVVTSNYIFII